MDNATTTTQQEKYIYFDEIEIDCNIHNLPFVGICSDTSCQEKKFMCMKCVKGNDFETISNCLRQKHELVSLSELLFRFFNKQENSSNELSEINLMIEAIKSFNKKEIIKNLGDFSASVGLSLEDNFRRTSVNFENLIFALRGSFEDFLKNLVKLNKISNFEEIREFLDAYCFDNLHKNQIKNKFYSLSTSNEQKIQYLINIRNLNNVTKTKRIFREVENLLYLNEIVNKSKKQIENEIDKKFNFLSNKLDNYLSDIKYTIIPPTSNLVFIRGNQIKFNSDPNELKYIKDISATAHKSNSIDSVFCSFKNIKGDTLVVWGTPSFSIEFYDLCQEKIIKTITEAHSSTIFCCRHYFDKKNKADLILTSSYDKSIKVWNGKENYSVILEIKNAHGGHYIYSACMLYEETTLKWFIVSSAPSEYMKIWDMKGNCCKQFGVNTESTYFIDTWYDTKNRKHYIINASSVEIKLFDFKTATLYKNFKGTPQTWHMSALIAEINGTPYLFDSDGNGNVRQWDVHSGTLLKTISTVGINLRGLCLWNDQYIIAAGSDYKVKVYDIQKGTFCTNLSSHTSTVCSINKVVHPKYGECLISHALDGKLKLWSKK